MLTLFGLETLRAEWGRAVVGIGTFDGVHRGHQAVLRRLLARAAEAELPAVLVTFDRHPALVLAPSRAPRAIASLGANLRAFDALGVPVTVVLPFNAWLSRLSAETFLGDLLVGRLRAEALVVGHDFALGADREGDVEWLRERLPTEVVPAFEVEGARVSSSAIRSAVEEGDLSAATRLLGRPFEIEGVVVGGRRLGRTLGYPTANLARAFDGVLPPNGVYACRATVAAGEGAGEYAAALSIGVRPSVDASLGGGGARSIEAYLMEYPGASLYGREVRLALHARLRGEERFPSLDALKAQLALDVARAREAVAPALSRASEGA